MRSGTVHTGTTVDVVTLEPASSPLLHAHPFHVGDVSLHCPFATTGHSPPDPLSELSIRTQTRSPSTLSAIPGSRDLTSTCHTHPNMTICSRYESQCQWSDRADDMFLFFRRVCLLGISRVPIHLLPRNIILSITLTSPVLPYILRMARPLTHSARATCLSRRSSR